MASGLEITCICGTRLVIDAEEAGRTIRCPECGAELLLDETGAALDRPPVSSNDDEVDELVPESVESTDSVLPEGADLPELWEMDGKRFKTLAAFERYVRGRYPQEIADEIMASLEKER